MVDILREARLFLVESLKDQINPYETVHPWRKDWKYVVLHTLRVEQTVINILAQEQHSLTAEEIENLQLATILHDIGKFVNREQHAPVGAKIAGEWLKKQALSEDAVLRIVDLIANHANKTGQEADYSKAVLQDADVLDEIGALSIFMTGNWVDRSSPFFFDLVKERIQSFEIRFCEDRMQVLNTAAAKKILQERQRFIKGFADQLQDELASNCDIDDLLKTM